MRFTKLNMFLATVMLFSGSLASAIAAPKAAPAQAAAPAQQQAQADTNEGKLIRLVGPTFMVYHGKSVQIGTFDPAKKSASSTLVFNAPENDGGISFCQEGATDLKKCATLKKDGTFNVTALNVPSLTVPKVTTPQLTLTSVKFADLPAKAADGTVSLCGDCVVKTETTSFFGSKSTTESPATIVVSKGGTWYNDAGLPVSVATKH